MAISKSGVARLEAAREAETYTEDKPETLNIRELASLSNILPELSEGYQTNLAREVIEGYRADIESRSEWEKLMKQANKLALQIMEKKTFPWPNASNIKFPLLTVATLQFSARAYPALVKAPEIVKCRVIGQDPQGMKRARAQRVGAHMSYQILEEDESWEEHHDRLLMILPIAGAAFKKSYYDAAAGHNKSELILAQDLIVNYYTKSLPDAERKTHKFCLFPREVRERELNGIYSEQEHGEPQPEFDEDKTASDQRQGLQETPTDNKKPYTMLEQHLFLDLDGDGYEEPYVATVCLDSEKIVRLVNRFERIHTEQDRQIRALQSELTPLLQMADASVQQEQPITAELQDKIDSIQAEIARLKAEEPTILKIDPMEFFTKYGFIPSPDGGFYDLGFGALLGPINESVNSLINQLVDSGTLQNGSTGFIGRGARQVGGEVRFRPYEWKRVNVAGGVLRDAIVPLPVNEPSPVLFNLLGLLVNYGERIASVTDMMVGENPGQNTPAYNAQQMLQQGMAVFTGIFKRIHRAMRDEFRKLYVLNRLHLSEQEYFEVLDGPTRDIFQRDYLGDPKDVRPTADPNAILSEEKMRQAAILVERAQLIPGYDLTTVEMRLLEAMGVQDVQEIFPLTEQGQPAIQPPPSPEFEIQRAEEQRRTMEAKDRREIGMFEAQTKARLAIGQLEEIEARSIKLLAEAGAIEGSEELEQQKLMLARIKEQREGLVALLQIGNDREKIRAERARAMASKSDNAGSTGTA